MFSASYLSTMEPGTQKNFNIFVKSCLDLYDTSRYILANEFDG